MQTHELTLDESSRRVFVLAAEEATRHSHDYIGTEHMLLAMMHEAEPAMMRALRHANVSAEEVYARVDEMLLMRDV